MIKWVGLAAMSVCEQAKGRGERQYTDKAADAAKKLASRFMELQGMIVNVRQHYQLWPNCKEGKRQGLLDFLGAGPRTSRTTFVLSGGNSLTNM